MQNKHNPGLHNRKSIRLKDYDYSSPSDYFITICTKDRDNLFGEVVDGGMVLNKVGKIIRDCWHGLPSHYPYIFLDEFVIMPNHVHFVITILADDPIVGAGFKPAQIEMINEIFENRAGLKPAPTGKQHKLSEIIRGFKTFSARKINEIKGTRGNSVWQRNYYEHIVGSEKELDKIRDYIISNPNMYERDRNNIENIWF